jgi:hypothetical protein
MRILTICASFWALPTIAYEIPPANTKLPPPTVVHVGYYIKSIKINNKDETASIEAYYWFRFKIPKDTSLISQIKKVEFVNAEVRLEKAEDFVMYEKIMGEFYYISGKVKGLFSFHPDFSKYPLDKQMLAIQIEHPIFTQEELIFVPDSSTYMRSGVSPALWGISKNMEGSDIIVEKSAFEIGKEVYETDFGDLEWQSKTTTYSKLSYFIYVGRTPAPYLLKFLLPLLFILCAAYLVYFIPSKELELTCGLSVTALLAAIAFQWTISNDLPSVGYLTSVDKIFYLSYFLIVMSMVESLYAYHLDKSGKQVFANRLDLWGRILVPIIFAGGVLIVLMGG